MKPTVDIIGIVNAGGGIIIDANGKPTVDLIGIANAAAKSGATVTFAGVGGKPTVDLIGIANAGKGRAILDLRSE